MAIELLDAVRQAEEKADAIRKDAAEQARNIIKSVEEATLESDRRAAAELRAAYQTQMNKIRGEIEARIAQSAGEKQKALENMRADASARENAAAALIVERVLSHGHR